MLISLVASEVDYASVGLAQACPCNYSREAHNTIEFQGLCRQERNLM